MRGGPESSISRVPVEWESLERQFETEPQGKRKDRAESRPRDLPSRQRPRHRPALPRWLSGDGTENFDRSCQKRPCPYPITPHPRTFRQLTSVCESRTGLLARDRIARYRPALLALSAHRRGWVRPPDAWVPPEGDAERQFGSLIRHLFALYDVPRFLDTAWTEGLTPDGVKYQGWFMHVAAGRNPRTARDLPFPMTKRMAHHFLRAPDDLGIMTAIRYGQVTSLGGDERLARSLVGTRLVTDFREHEFWTTVIRWFIAHPAVSPVDHGPIIDFLNEQRFVPSVPNPTTRLRGQPRQTLLVPPQPHLSMKGRTPEAMLRAVEQWHRRLGSQRMAFSEWKPSGIVPLVIVVGEGADRRVFETTELICTEELQQEGQAMRHCIASYWRQCESGQTSVWSMTVEDASGRVERLLTLEVRNGQKQVVQARGDSNRMPTASELRVLDRWEVVGGPSLSCRVTI